MFSKALFKQSVKSNWVMWTAITAATCVILAIVIIVLGSINIDGIRSSLKGIFSDSAQQSYVQENAIDSYTLSCSTLEFENGITAQISSDTTARYMLNSLTSSYDTAISEYETANGTATDEAKLQIQTECATSLSATFQSLGFSASEAPIFALAFLQAYDASGVSATTATTTEVIGLFNSAYYVLIYEEAYQSALEDGYTEEEALAEADSAKDIASDMVTAYGTEFTDFTTSEFKEYALNYVNNMLYSSTYDTYIEAEYTDEDAKVYAVAVKVMSNTAITSYELYIGEGYTEDEAKAKSSVSLMDQIDEDVAEALTELGNMDIYGLVIGSMFYRIVGVLLPLMFVIITANGLVAGQVDSGSMAYVLSTPTKRRTVTFTQMVYLFTALLAMFLCITVFSVVSVAIVGGNSFAISYGEILIFNLGAFATLFAFAGWCFMGSCLFNRSKHSIAFGGGVSIFMLVCTILGLFGSSIMPSAMRISQMNFFNYLSIISLFDTTAIMSGSLSFIWQFAILFGIGIVCFAIGMLRFKKKDLPL